MDKIDILVKYGIDYKTTMERFMNDSELYIRCIEMFPEDDNFAALDEAMKKKDYDTAFLCAHTLKGVTGNLGLTPLYRSIYELVEALRAKKYSDADSFYKTFVEEKAKFDELLA